MNRIILCNLIAVVILGFSSCKRDVVDRLPGEWNYNEIGTNTVVYNNVTNTEEINNTGTATFTEDGNGSISLDGDITPLTWEASNDTINIIKNGISISYFVTNNDKTLQEWETKYVETGTDFTFTSELKLTLSQ